MPRAEVRVRQVVLLRGVNVGGHHRLPMKDFAAILAELGLLDVRTIIQSGNALFDGPEDPALSERISAGIGARFGFAPAAVVRPVAEVRALVEGNPLRAEGVPDDRLHYGFLVGPPRANAGLDAARFPRERAVLVGRDLCLAYLDGVGGSKMTSEVIDRAMGVTVTVRNARTTAALVGHAP